ncbi:MAG: colanic acid biosynthesis acetyltransferase WcaF [Asticcacaulis sp.]
MSVLDYKTTNPREGGASFSLSNRLSRLVWNICWLVLASWTPPFAHPWRRFLLRSFGAKIQGKSDVRGSARVWYPGYLVMGDNSIIADRVICYNMALITIGDYTVISQGAHLCAGSHDIVDPHFQLIARPIHIGKECWVAAEAFVGPGVTMGEGAVLGARGVAFRDMDANGVYAGNPAKKIKDRR